jgi:hypothetical protein
MELTFSQPRPIVRLPERRPPPLVTPFSANVTVIQFGQVILKWFHTMLVLTISAAREQQNVLAGMASSPDVLIDSITTDWGHGAPVSKSMESMVWWEWALRPPGRNKVLVDYGIEASKATTCQLKASILIREEIKGRIPFFMSGSGVDIQWNWKYRRKELQYRSENHLPPRYHRRIRHTMVRVLQPVLKSRASKVQQVRLHMVHLLPASGFATFPAVVNVSRIVTNSSMFSCSLSSRCIFRLTGPSRHRKYHLKPYRCLDPSCSTRGTAFSLNKDLVRHESQHNGRRFYCSHSGCSYAFGGGKRGFSRQDNLKRHTTTQH